MINAITVSIILEDVCTFYYHVYFCNCNISYAYYSKHLVFGNSKDNKQ